MTGIELYRWLKTSGTGENKLCHAKECLRADRGATAEGVTLALFAAGVSPVTLAKARRIVAAGKWDSADDLQSARAEGDDFDAELSALPEEEAEETEGPPRRGGRAKNRSRDQPDGFSQAT